MAGENGNQAKSTPAATCLKILLTGLNIFYWLTGIAILVLGIWVKVDLYKYMEMASQQYDNTAAPYVLICTGLAIMFITSLGCCCTIKGNNCLLYVYGLFLGIVFIMEFSVAISAFVFKSKASTGFEVGLKHYMELYSSDGDKRETVDDLQQSLKCCGDKNYTDWYSIPWQNKTLSDTVPDSCYSDTRDKTGTMFDQGCYSKVSSFMESNFLMIGGIAIGFSFVQLFGAMLACCLGKSISKSKYEQIE